VGGAWIDEDLLCEVRERWRRSDWGIGSREEAGIATRGASNPSAGEREMARLTVTGFAEYVTAGNLRRAGTLVAL
jgi:hypothetical protein